MGGERGDGIFQSSPFIAAAADTCTRVAKSIDSLRAANDAATAVGASTRLAVVSDSLGATKRVVTLMKVTTAYTFLSVELLLLAGAGGITGVVMFGTVKGVLGLVAL